jgi:hypothetical protein
MSESEREIIFRDLLVDCAEGARRTRKAAQLLSLELDVPVTTAANWVYANRTPAPWRQYALFVAYLLRKDAAARNWIASKIETGIAQLDAIDACDARAQCQQERSGEQIQADRGPVVGPPRGRSIGSVSAA